MAYYFQDVLLLEQAGRRAAVPDPARPVGEQPGAAWRAAWASSTRHSRPSGQEQAERVGERMAAYGVDAIYASPLQRAYNTAAPIAKRTGIEIRVIDDLQEINEPMRRGQHRPEREPRDR